MFMKILGVESSATSASAAVYSDGRILAVDFSNTGLTHSQTLLPMVDSVLKTSGVDISDVDYLAVSNGPGSFTGVRIGVSLVKGLADPLGKKCLGLSTLEVIAKPLENTGVYAVAVMDARCNQVYTAQFDCSDGFNRKTPDEALSISDLAEQLKNVNGKIMLIGDGALICYNKIKAELPDILIAPLNIRYQSASSVVTVAAEMLEADLDIALDSADLLPNYLRLSQAERELKKKEKG